MDFGDSRPRIQNWIVRHTPTEPLSHGGLNQKKSQKWCLGLGPIYIEITTPEVFKTSLGKIPKTHPSETTAKNSSLEVTLFNKVHFFNSQSIFFVKHQILQRSHLHNKFSISAQSEHFNFLGNDSIISDFSEKSKCSDWADIENLLFKWLLWSIWYFTKKKLIDC